MKEEEKNMLDIKIVNGTLIDGSGAHRFVGDVGIRDGKLVMNPGAAEAKETIDAT
jgi:N-acyl-D-aspartate/D-glutamate deacylase